MNYFRLMIFYEWLLFHGPASSIQDKNQIPQLSPLKWLEFLSSSDYDPTLHPLKHKDLPTSVTVSVFIESLGNLDIKSMEFDVDMYLVERWNDSRLARNQNQAPENSENRSDTFLFGQWEHVNQLWRPDIYFVNSKGAEYNSVTVPNMNLRVSASGSVRWSVRVHATLSCHMDLHYYPFDSQICHMKLVTYGNTIDLVKIVWAQKDAIVVNPDILEAEFRLMQIEADICEAVYDGKESINIAANFSCLDAKFTLRRSRGQYLMQVFAPSFAIVCISWISFWIDPAAIPGRVGLCVTTLLTLSTQSAGLSFRLPLVGYAKAQDIWMCACLMSLFGTLVEFAFVTNMVRKADKLAADHHRMAATRISEHAQTIRDGDSDQNTDLDDSPMIVKLDGTFCGANNDDTSNVNETLVRKRHPNNNALPNIMLGEILMKPIIGHDYLMQRSKYYQSLATKGDKIARVVFPGVFFIFTAVYFVVFY